jgi:magnesium chelatase family protein
MDTVYISCAPTIKTRRTKSSRHAGRRGRIGRGGDGRRVFLDRIATPDGAGREFLLRATEHMHLTARGYHRVLRVARTIADLDGTAHISRGHIAEALSFRRIAPDRR